MLLPQRLALDGTDLRCRLETSSRHASFANGEDLAALILTTSHRKDQGMTVEADLAEFAILHRQHGPLAAKVTDYRATGSCLAVACPCGITFRRRLTAEEHLDDLVVALMRSQQSR